MSWPVIRDTGLGAIAVTVVLLAVTAVQHSGSSAVRNSDSAAGVVAEPARTPAALFVGDDYAAGGGGVVETFARITSRRMHWVYLRDAQPGTGFVADGQQWSSSNGPYLSRLARDRSQFRPDYVIVTGGRNDAEQRTAAVRNAATGYLPALHRAFPKARLIIVAPFWVDSDPPSTLLALRDTERGVARKLGATFVDPLAARWITNDNQATYIRADRVLPNPDGHQYLAQRLSGALQSVIKPPAS
jgi:hypothetical protein